MANRSGSASTSRPAEVLVRRFRPVAGQDGAERSEQVTVLTVPAGAAHFLKQHAAERICVLLEGRADLSIGPAGAAGGQNATNIGRGAVIHSRSGHAFTVTNTADSAIQFLVLAAADPSGTAALDSAKTDPATDAAQVECFSLFDVADEVLHRPEAGFFHMGTRMLLNASHSYQSFIFGQSSFAPENGIHALHRHAGADEMFYVWDGEGSHLNADGTEHPMRPGDAVFVPRGEWHGFRNTGVRPVRAFFGLIGAGDMQRAGNEVLDNGETGSLTAGPTITLVVSWRRPEAGSSGRECRR